MDTIDPIPDLNITRDMVEMNEHVNIMAKVIGQTQIAPDLWAINLDWGLLGRITDGKQYGVLYFDRQITWKKGRFVKTSGFNVIVRHLFECADSNGVAYYFIAAGAVFEAGATDTFRSEACWIQ